MWGVRSNGVGVVAVDGAGFQSLRCPLLARSGYLTSLHSVKPLLSLSRVWKARWVALSSFPEAWS